MKVQFTVCFSVCGHCNVLDMHCVFDIGFVSGALSFQFTVLDLLH